MSQSHRPSDPSPICRVLRVAALLLAASLLAGPALGYIVFLKDGSQIKTKEKYRIEGDIVHLVMPNGTRTTYKASEIDIEKTERINVVDYGRNATLLEGMNKPKPPPKPTPEDEDPSFGQYISGRNLALPEVRKREVTRRVQDLPTTTAGFVDLMALRREPYPDTAVTSDVLGYLRGQGLNGVRIFKGTSPDRPLLEIVATSEASVFKALKDSANGLVQIHERFPQQVAAFELVLMTESQARAGQFVLTPDLANELVTGRMSPSTFFLRFVEF